ncbi:MAG: DNA-processing protein DprA [Eubacterium sp.]|nr:DNA-processing protein DprA [Eubacterium sp.]
MRKSGQEILEYWIGMIPGIGTVKAERLVRAAGGIDSLYAMGELELKKLNILGKKEISSFLESRDDEKMRKSYEQMRKKRIRCISRFGSDYPEKLKQLARPPLQLYVKGEMPDFSKLSVGIVGARECSCYGRDMARMFGYRLAKAGVQIISGMARGVDGWAHQGALESGGRTFAVLGCGADICYPAVHERLYASIEKRGGIISEYRPGTKAKPQYFPMRNRIISGISDGILLVEAREQSGSLITAEAALEQGRDVFVIPGRIGDELSVGCNRLIVQGAMPVLSPEDILDYYQIENREVSFAQEFPLDEKIYRRLTKGAAHMDVLSRELSASPTDVMKALLRMQKQGKVREMSRGNFEAF